MTEETKGKEYLTSSVNILEFAIKQWKILIGVGLVAGAMAAIFSGPKFITPVFTSEAFLYPANLGSYSDETGLEQMQQYLQSNTIRDTIIKKFDLYKEYEIDSTQPTTRTEMIKRYGESITVDETQFESIRLTASSTDPKKAKAIIEEVINQLNLTIRKTEREKYWEIVEINKMLLDQKKDQVDSLQDLIREYSTKYGLLDYIEQSEEVTEGYLQFLLSGKKGADYEEVKELYNNLEEHGRAFHNMHAQLNVVNEEYMLRLTSYEHAMKDYKKEQTYTNILVSPEVPDKKSWPIRWLIFVSAVASSVGFTFALLMILGYQNKK